MGYGLGSDDPEELSYYNKIKKDMEDMKKDSVKKVFLYLLKLTKIRRNEFKYFFIN